MKISFTTLGCPAWDLETICRRGQEYGFDGVDFRGYRDELDVTRLPEFNSGSAATRRMLADAGLETSGISSSIHVCVHEQLEANLEEARRTIAVCHGLGAQNIRVFGGGDVTKSSLEALAQIGCDTVNQILALDGAGELHWLFETHDIWTKSTNCKILLDNIPNPAFGALWDIGNNPGIGGETPAEIMAAFGDRVGNTHIKDAVNDPGHPDDSENGWRYVFPGQGQVPLKESVELLIHSGYTGWLTFEHEKRWIPSLPEPEEAFPAYVAWAKSLF